MVFSRTLLYCQKKLPEGAAPDSGLILQWARQFQVCKTFRSKIECIFSGALFCSSIGTYEYDGLAANTLGPAIIQQVRTCM